MRRVWCLAVVLAVAGCSSTSAQAPSPAASAAPTAPGATAAATAGATAGATDGPTRAPTAPAPTARPTPTPVLGAPCSANAPLEVSDVIDGDPECFHGEIDVTGWLDWPPAMGWEGPMVEPAWLYYPPNQVLSALWSSQVIEPDHWCRANLACNWFFLHLAPGSEIKLGLKPRSIVVRGHFEDPAAPTCHYVPEPSSEYVVHDEDAVRQCESSFVVTAILSPGG